MTLPPIHRSLTCWSGILVMGFIGWAWRDSLDFDSHLTWRSYTLGNWNGGIYCSYYGDEPLGFVTPRLTFGRINEAMDSDLLPDPSFSTGNLEGLENNWHLCIPHWLILLAVAVSWGGLLLWRARRIKKAVAISQA